ncbi:MAG: EAL domain-containing protein [Sulfurimonas sp.]|nr:EAL domain-containing protein [Sulfurimonas sp.]
MKKLFIIFILLQTILFADAEPLQKIKLQLQWKYQFEFAGFIMAKEMGYYKDVGLNVELIEYKNGMNVIKELEEKRVDYAVTNSIISYKNNKLSKVTLLATYFQRSPLIMITQKNIKSILNLQNKKIMISSNDQFNSTLTTLLNYFNIGIQNNTFVEPTYNIDDFINKKVDASTAFRSNELYLLDKKKIQYNIIDPVEYGFPTTGNNTFTTYEKVKDKPQEVKNFLSATKKGWEYALKNIEEVAKLIHTKYQPNKSLEHLIYEGKIVKELMLLDLYEIGEINKEFVLRAYKQLIKNNKLDKDQMPNKLILDKTDLNQWIKQKYIEETQNTIALIIGLFLFLIIILLLIWSLKMKKEIKRRKIAEKELKYLAEHDPLTNLPNRILFTDRLKQAIKNATRYSENIAVLFIDLDHFKNINDSLGHNAGDILLQTISKRLNNSIRKSDTVARLGGDEFSVILDHFSHIDTIKSVVNNIINSVKEPIYINNQKIYTTLSLGVSIYPQDGIDTETLIKNADIAMYKAKDNGRNNYQFYAQNMSKKAYERVILENQLRQSIKLKEMEVYYQLQIDAKDDSIIGMEALVRWNHPNMGLVSPNIFISLAEDIGFIIELDEWVTKEAILQFKQWYLDGLNPGILSLNLSIQRVEQDGFISSIENILNSNLLATKYLSFEITETKIMKNPEKSIETLNKLHKLGIKLSIDDFGTGHSSLSYLKKLPIDKLKIDRSFIKDIPKDLDDMEITKTIIAMAKNLNLNVIAEGVETKEQKDFLVQNACHEIQGYLYHKPSPADKIKQILQGK